MPKAFVLSRYGGPEVSDFAEIERPVPAAGQVLVAVRAAGVNPADWKRRRGGPQAVPLDGPTPMGRELSGVIEEVGPGVEGFAPGDAVFGVPPIGGSFAEYAILSVDQMAKKPSGVSFLDAATLGVAAATAYDGVNQLDPKADETLLIIGIGGGVGIAAAQIAIGRGARVIGTASASKRELVESFGAEHVAYSDSTIDKVRGVAPNGVDAIFDMVGFEALRELAPLVNDPKRMISISDAATAEALGGQPIDRKRNSAVLEAVGHLVESGQLKPTITEVYPFERAAEAMAVVEAGHAAGKVVLEMD